MLGTQASLEDLRDRLENISARNEASLLEVLLSVVRDVDQRMGYPAGHIDRVMAGVERLAQAFSFPAPEVRNIKRAALACNVGMVSVPQELLAWPGPLVEEQQRLVRQHCVQSADAIRSLPFLAAARGDILSHHERFDGKGYPEGLRGPQIPFGARIIPVVETYEALTSARPYRKQPYSKAESLEIIRGESSRQFDPLVVEQFLKICG
jgi:polar amino acid transport system substrate-binding protein